MISEKQITHISKFLSLVLRHQPETIDIPLDQNGWADVSDLIEKANKYGVKFDSELLHHIVETNSKKRFAFNETLDKIRASQGHSVEIELGYTSQKPPEILYHGTSEKSVQSILDTGLEKQGRQTFICVTTLKQQVKLDNDTENHLFLKCLLNKCIKTIFSFSFLTMEFG